MSKPSFYFVRISGKESFVLIEAFGEIPEAVPKEISHLVPGNGDGGQDHLVVLEKDDEYLETQVKSVGSHCSSWFGYDQKKVPWTQVSSLTYRLVGTFIFM